MCTPGRQSWASPWGPRDGRPSLWARGQVRCCHDRLCVPTFPCWSPAPLGRCEEGGLWEVMRAARGPGGRREETAEGSLCRLCWAGERSAGGRCLHQEEGSCQSRTTQGRRDPDLGLQPAEPLGPGPPLPNTGPFCSRTSRLQLPRHLLTLRVDAPSPQNSHQAIMILCVIFMGIFKNQ